MVIKLATFSGTKQEFLDWTAALRRQGRVADLNGYRRKRKKAAL